MHVIWATGTFESYAGSGICIAENMCCTVNGIQEHDSYLRTHTRKVGLHCIHMYFEMLLRVNEDDFDRL